MNHGCWYGVAKSSFLMFVIVTVCGIGWYGGQTCGLLPRARFVKKAWTANVFAEAPLKSMRNMPCTDGCTKEMGPPEYVKRTLLKVQSVQSKPSSDWPTSLNVYRSKRGNSNIERKAGSAPSTWIPTGSWLKLPPLMTDRGGVRGGACASVDVWIPRSMNNTDVLQTPSANDPNAIVTLDITPPAKGKGGNCSVWVYHSGKAPDKLKPAERAADSGGGRASAVNQDFTRLPLGVLARSRCDRLIRLPSPELHGASSEPGRS